VARTGHGQPHLPDGRRRGQFTVGEPAVEPEMDVQRRLVVEVVQQVFAVRLGVDERPAVEQRGPGGEPPLRAGHPDDLTGEERPMPRRQPMNGVSLWHRRTVAGLSPSGESLGSALVTGEGGKGRMPGGCTTLPAGARGWVHES
jgi:hypothetical protein